MTSLPVSLQLEPREAKEAARAIVVSMFRPMLPVLGPIGWVLSGIIGVIALFIPGLRLLGVLFMACALAGPMVVWLVIRRVAGRLLRSSAGATIDLSEEHIGFASPGARTELAWSRVTGSTQGALCTLLHFGRGQAITIPLRVQSPEMVALIRASTAGRRT